ncbi:MAG TPA: hypothetical protein VEL03_15815 [Streptosporangiaceae bacterium]|nr:hypothetical protein [Streptosporangiaceae bacterium]
MIRRGFWLVAGAALGITGYRKVTRLARTLTGQQAAGLAGPRSAAVADSRPGRLAGRQPRGLPAAGRGQLADGEPESDTRAGQLAAPRSPGQLAAVSAQAARPAAAVWAVRLVAGARAAAGFARDVREGMADYRDLHGGQLGRSLGSQAGQIASGRSPRGTREP